MIHVIAIITAKPGKREEILKHARANLARAGAKTRKARGGSRTTLRPYAIPGEKRRRV